MPGLFDPWRGRLTPWRIEAAFRFVVLGAYLFMIYSFSSRQSSELPPIAIDDRLVHAVEYLGLGLVTLFALAGVSRRGLTPVHFAAAVLFGFLYALSDEYHQSFIPTREPSMSDLLFDLAGLLLAAITIRAGVGRGR